MVCTLKGSRRCLGALRDLFRELFPAKIFTNKYQPKTSEKTRECASQVSKSALLLIEGDLGDTNPSRGAESSRQRGIRAEAMVPRQTQQKKSGSRVLSLPHPPSPFLPQDLARHVESGRGTELVAEPRSGVNGLEAYSAAAWSGSGAKGRLRICLLCRNLLRFCYCLYCLCCPLCSLLLILPVSLLHIPHNRSSIITPAKLMSLSSGDHLSD